MKVEFYDAQENAKVKADVTEKVTYGSDKRKRYALKGRTKDGRNLTKFVGEADWNRVKI